MHYKDIVCGITGVLGSMVSALFGGFDAAIKTLLMFMTTDYISGIVVAAVFKASVKTKNGALESMTCWKGICKKFMTLVLVFVAHRLDLSLGVTYIRDTVTIAFITSELISIIENAGLMGVPIPNVLTRAVDVLKQKVEGKDQDE